MLQNRLERTGGEVAEGLLMHLTPAVFATEHRCFALTPALDRLAREAGGGSRAPQFGEGHREELIQMFGRAWQSCEAELAAEGPASVIEPGFEAVGVLVNYLAEQPERRPHPFQSEIYEHILAVRMLHNLAFTASLRFELRERVAKREAEQKAEREAKERAERGPAEIIIFPGSGLFG